MNPLALLVAFGIVLLLVLLWVLRDPRKLAESSGDLESGEDSNRRHVIYFPQMRQALAAEDYTFLASRGFAALAHTVRNERRKIALTYLACLRSDFLRLWRLARVIASMSQQVGAAQELERVMLAAAFSWRYEVIRLKFVLGFAPLPALGSLSETVSRLSMQLETAMKELGERAALASQLASSLDGRGLHTS